MKSVVKQVLSVLGVAFLLVGCNNDYSGNRYEGKGVGEVARTDYGTIVSLRKVEIKPEGSGTGAALGAVAGGLVGSMFGKGGGKLLGVGAGAVAGGIAGNAIETKATDGVEYTVKLDNGSVISLTQGPTPPLSVGQRVAVINSNKGPGRIVPE
jgi:outer membrane lipoprotein SlyB